MSVLATDSFTRADAADLGANWTQPTGAGALPVVSNQVGKPSALAWEYNNTVTYPADQSSQLVIKTLANQSDEGMGPAVHVQSGGDLYFAQTNTTETRLYKRVGGGYFQIGSDGAACAVNDVLSIEWKAATGLTVKKNGSTIIGPNAESAIATGNAGLWCSNGGAAATAGGNWEGGDFSAAAASAPIGFDPRTKAPPGMPGPRDALGFLRQQIWDYTIPIAAPSTAAQAAASVAMSTAFAIGVAIFSGTGATTAQSAAQATGTGIASGAGVATAQSTAQAPATGIAAGAGLSVSQTTLSAGSAPTGAGSGASTAQSLARATGAPTGAGGGCTTAQSTTVAVGSPIGAGVGISSSGGALCVAIGQAVVPGVGGVTVAQSIAIGSGAAIGAGGGCTTSVSTARATSASIAAGAGVSVSPSRAIAGSAPTSAGAGISVSQSTATAAQGADIPAVTAAGLVLIPNDGRLSLIPNNGQLVLTPNNGALSLAPNDGTLSLIPDT